MIAGRRLDVVLEKFFGLTLHNMWHYHSRDRTGSLYGMLTPFNLRFAHSCLLSSARFTGTYASISNS